MKAAKRRIIKTLWKLIHPLETVSDVFHTAIGKAFDHPLVGGKGVQGSEISIITAGLDIVEGLGMEGLWQLILAGVPGGLHVLVLVLDVHGEVGHVVWVGVASHEADASDP